MSFKYFFFLPFLIAAFNAKCQFNKGTKMIGGSIGSGSFYSGTTNYSFPAATGYRSDNNNFSLNVNPSLGIFLNKSVVLGVSFLLNSSYQKNNYKSLSDTIYSSNSVKGTDIGAGLFLRYFFQNAKTLYPFIQLHAEGGTGFGKSNGFSFGTDPSGAYKEIYTGKTTGKFFFNPGVDFGLAKMLNQQIALEVSAGYVHFYTKFETQINSVRHYSANADLTQRFQPTQKFSGNGVRFGIGIQLFL